MTLSRVVNPILTAPNAREPAKLAMGENNDDERDNALN